MYKIVYQCDANGFYLNKEYADESPLEPGVWIIPGGCVEQAPPAYPEHLIPRWDGYSWELVDRSIADSTYVSPKDRERLWRNTELARADQELNKVQDGMGAGTVSAWRSYRVALRGWPAEENFPDVNYRPSAPDAK